MSILCREPIKIDHRTIPDLTFREVWEWFIKYHWEEAKKEREKNDPSKSAVSGAVLAAVMHGANADEVRKAVERDLAKQKRDEYYKKLESS